MKAVISKSIGNTFLIKSGDAFFDIVFWRSASRLINCAPVIRNIIDSCPKEIKVNQKKVLSDEKLKKLLSENVVWIDKNRRLKDVISLGIQEHLIYIRQYEYREKKSAFFELENPKITYVFKINGFELIVKKVVFMHFASEVTIREKRAA